MISVIVPVYYGRSCIRDVIGMIERNAVEAGSAVELIFVNDSPKERIDDICTSSKIHIVLLNNTCNQGIHYSRVRGIRSAHGEYVLMLDQDDNISDDYLSSQIARIGNADMIVANGYEELSGGRRILYRYAPMQWTVKSGIFYTIFGCRILSPGQCLIRKESIPEVWFQNIIKHNGADDYLLWIYMLARKSRVGINRDALYVHRLSGKNASADKEQMEVSVQEVLRVARENGALSLPACRYIEGSVKGRQTVFRKIVRSIIRIGNEINKGRERRGIK